VYFLIAGKTHYTVGIPKYGETVIAYDSETGKELPYGEVGEICVFAETMFLHRQHNILRWPVG